MRPDSHLLLNLNQALLKISKSSLKSYIAHLKQSNPNIHTADNILLAYCLKAIDLFEGIILLQESNLMEDAQILIRSLFETNLNTYCVIKLASDDLDNAAHQVMNGTMIMGGKKATQQNTGNDDFFDDVGVLKTLYSEQEIKEIERFGFPQCSIRQRAINDNKLEWYNVMYKNFSRNAHALDIAEYLVKTNVREYHETYEEMHELRDGAALEHAHTCFYQIILYYSRRYDWGIEDNLSDIRLQFNQIARDQ
tara:strand:+ start:811 stop:1563 length:753 start_codon:yes stop_codon:yes gene_type:complete